MSTQEWIYLFRWMAFFGSVLFALLSVTLMFLVTADILAGTFTWPTLTMSLGAIIVAVSLMAVHEALDVDGYMTKEILAKSYEDYKRKNLN